MQSRRDAGITALVLGFFASAVVGVHLLPLAPLLRDRRLVAIVALVALVVGLADTVAPSTVTGVGAGVLLLAFAVAELAGALLSSAGPA